MGLVAGGCNVAESDQTAIAPPAHTEQQSATAPIGDGGARIFVSNYRSDSISVVEGNPGAEVATIAALESPHGLALRTSKPPLLAVANSTGFGVTLIDPKSLEKKGFVETSRGPQDLVFSRDGKHLFVISPLSFDLQVVDVAAMRRLGEPIKFEKKPRRILSDSKGERIFVLLVGQAEGGGGAAVAVLDANTREILTRIPVGRHPDAMALGNNGETLATTSFDDSTITVIDTGSLEVRATYPALTGMGLAIHPTKPVAYSCESFDDVVQVLDLNTGAEIAKLSAGSWPTFPQFGSEGRYLYVPHEDSDSLVTWDTLTNKVVAKVAVGREPIEVAVYESASPS